MPTILKLRGAGALSAFRLEKLNSRLALVHSGLRVAAVEFVHFVELERALSAGESEVLDRLLAYGEAPADRGARGVALVVVPRVGTISPWSSKATDIARPCGLAAVRRIERGVAYRLEGGELVARYRSAIVPLLHDRMTETVFEREEEASALFR
ncbi:MAG: phosphoribosylformylglycinamidine synthase, partial [Betaproteobacteria bacterium]|nr:phosphoribosylformylglycinamidine synthase [Betaproteobacteria bacterium]